MNYFNLLKFLLILQLMGKSHSQLSYTIDMINSEMPDHIDSPTPVRCYGVYGCFPITEPWACSERVHNVFPLSPSVIGVKFPLFTQHTRESPTLIDLNDPDTIRSANISRNHSIYVISHGFVELGNAPWMIRMMNELLDHESDAAVMLVDWRGGSSIPYYQAVANIRVAAAVLAHVIAGIFLELEMENIDGFHLIGHSLGAHLSGYAGYYLQRDFNLKVGRITGLDPAKPYFEFTHPMVRLDPTDAKFVDVVHTDCGTFARNSFGLKQPVGHLDYYPNGGEIQPVCTDAHPMDVTCHHKTAVDYFTESINTKCPFMAISCSSYREFLSGHCNCGESNKNCFTFGFHSRDSYRRVFNVTSEEKFEFAKPDSKPKVEAYLTTTAASPFCKVHSRITIQIANRVDHEGDIGLVKVAIVGSEKKSEQVQLTSKIQEFKRGKSSSFFVTHSHIGDEIKSLRIQYFYSLEGMRIYKPLLHIEFVEIESIEGGKRYRMCPLGGRPLVSYEVDEYNESYCDDGLGNVVIN